METNYLLIYSYQFLLLFIYCTFCKSSESYVMKGVLLLLFFLSCGIITSNLYINSFGFVLFITLLIATGMGKVLTNTTIFRLNFAIILLTIGAVLTSLNQLVNSVFIFSISISLLTIFLSILGGSVFLVLFKKDRYNFEIINVNDIDVKSYYISDVNEDNKLKEILTSIHKWFDQSKCYLNPDYTLDQLQIDLEIDRKMLSKAINRIEGVNFYQFLASYRIKYAKKMLKKNGMYTLETLSNECGFYSKSSFNKYFKLFEGETPSRFKIKQT